MILAIDQGTTGTTCLVFDPEGRIAGRAYSEFEQHFPQPGWVEHDAGEIWTVTRRVAVEAIVDAGIQGARAGRDRDNQPARDGRRLGSGDGRAAAPGARLAGPPYRRPLRGAARGRPRGAGARAHRARPRPLLLGHQDRVAAAQRRGGGAGGLRHDRLLAAVQADRPPRDRLHQRLADDAVRHPQARLGRGAVRAARRRPGAAARAAALRPRIRDDLGVRRRGAGGGDRRRPAGGALRPGLPRRRQRQEHLRHRQLRPAQRRRAGARPPGRAC